MRRTLTALTAALTLAACTPAQTNPPAEPAPTTVSATTAPASSKVVLTVKGDGGKSTKTFTVRGDWDIEYTYDCRDVYGGTGNFQVWNEETGLANTYINDLGAKGDDVAHQHLGGTLALKVNTLCRWTLKVIDV